MQNNRIYAFKYSSNVYESGCITISLHYSKEQAEKAIKKHKQKKLDEFNELIKFNVDRGIESINSEFGEYERWFVEPVLILP